MVVVLSHTHTHTHTHIHTHTHTHTHIYIQIYTHTHTQIRIKELSGFFWSISIWTKWFVVCEHFLCSVSILTIFLMKSFTQTKVRLAVFKDIWESLNVSVTEMLWNLTSYKVSFWKMSGILWTRQFLPIQ